MSIRVPSTAAESLAAQFGNGATFSGEDGEADVPEVICYEMVR